MVDAAAIETLGLVDHSSGPCAGNLGHLCATQLKELILQREPRFFELLQPQCVWKYPPQLLLYLSLDGAVFAS